MTNHDLSSQSHAVTKPSSSSEKMALINRQVRILLGAYRKDDYVDPESFYMQVGLVLEKYTPETIIYVTSPAAGLQRTCKFPPSIAEIVEACEANTTQRHTEVVDRWQALADATREQLKIEQKQHNKRETLDELRAGHPPNWGLSCPPRMRR